MDRTERYQKLQNSSQFHQFLNKTLPFLIPISLLPFLLSYSSVISFLFFNFQSSSLLLQLFTHNLERKYMFLICNGILAIVFRSSGSNSPPPPAASNFHGNLRKHQPQGGKKSTEKVPPLRKEVVREETEEEEQTVSLDSEAAGKEIEVLAVNRQDNEEDQSENLVGSLQEDEEEEEEANVSTEELNKKFDEFIRKMREAIRTEVQS